MFKYLSLFTLISFTFANIILKEPFRKNNDISTKIVNKPFELLIKSNKNITGTICSTIIDDSEKNIDYWHKNYFNNQKYSYQTKEKNPIFNSNTAQKFAQIKYIYVANKNIKCPTNEGVIYYSDSFAIRPKKFKIVNIPSQGYAAENFPIKFLALDENNKPVKNYNEIKNISFSININTPKGCKYGYFNTTPIFKNGVADTTANYTDVGPISITILENNYEFSKIDRKDTNLKNRIIDPYTTHIVIYPYSIQTYSHFPQSNIYYISSNLNKHYVMLTTILNVINKNNDIVKNFDKNCFANNVILKYLVKKHTNKQNFIGLYNINHIETNDSKFNRWNSKWIIPKQIFKNGKGKLQIKFNIFKDYKKPLSIIKLNFRNLTAYTINQKKLYKESLYKTISFYYLKLFTTDIYTDKNITSMPLYVLVYDKNKTFNSKKEKLINWYIYKDYYLNNIKILGITKGYKYTNNTKLKVNAKIIKKDQNITLNIKNNKFKHFIIHIDTPDILWYSKFKNFNKNLNSYCTSHYCIEYKFNKFKKHTKEVKKGKFKGEEIKHSQTKHIGVKIYR